MCLPGKLPQLRPAGQRRLVMACISAARSGAPLLLHRHPDISHRFSWDGHQYLMDGHSHFSGRDFTTWDEGSGEAVLDFRTTFFKRHQVGEVVVSDKASLLSAAQRLPAAARARAHSNVHPTRSCPAEAWRAAACRGYPAHNLYGLHGLLGGGSRWVQQAGGLPWLTAVLLQWDGRRTLLSLSDTWFNIVRPLASAAACLHAG